MSIEKSQSQRNTYLQIGVAALIVVAISAIAIGTITKLGDCHLSDFWHSNQKLTLSIAEISVASFLAATVFHFLKMGISNKKGRTVFTLLQIMALVALLGLGGYQVYQTIPSFWLDPLVGAGFFIIPSIFYSFLTKIDHEDVPSIPEEQENTSAKSPVNPNQDTDSSKIQTMATVLKISDPIGGSLEDE